MVFRNLARPLVLIADARPRLRRGAASAAAAEDYSGFRRPSGNSPAPAAGGSSAPQRSGKEPDGTAEGDNAPRSEPSHVPSTSPPDKPPQQTGPDPKQDGDTTAESRHPQPPRQKMPRGNTHRPANHAAGTKASTSSRTLPSSTSQTGSIPRLPSGPTSSLPTLPSPRKPQADAARVPWSQRLASPPPPPRPRTTLPPMLPSMSRSAVNMRRRPKPARPPTLVHAAAEQPRARMTASDLVDLVASKPHLATRPTTAALYEYAVRTSDWKAQKNAWNLLPRERLPSLPPLRWAEVQHEVRDMWDKELRGGEATDAEKSAAMDAEKSATTDAENAATARGPTTLACSSSRSGTSMAPLSTSSRNTPLALPTEPAPTKRVEPLRALVYRHPPLQKLPHTNATPAEVLRHLHYLHLTHQPWSLAASVAAVRGAGGTLADEAHVLNLALAYAHTSATPIPEDRRPQPRYDIRYTYKGRPMNPYLNRIAYAPTDVDPVPLIREFATLSLAPLGRATLGQAVQLRLLAPTTLADLAGILALFPKAPGPETWRHIALHALVTDDEALAHHAFLGAKEALAVERAAVSQYEHDEREAWGAWLEDGGRKSGPEQRKSGTQPSTLAGKLNAVPITNTKPAPLAAPIDTRFAHLGVHLTRWERTLNHIRKRGWAHRGADVAPAVRGGTPSLMRRWVWLGRAGEDGAAERFAAFERQLEHDILARGGEAALKKARSRWGYTAEQVEAHKQNEPWRLWDRDRRPGIGWRPQRPWDDDGVNARVRPVPRPVRGTKAEYEALDAADDVRVPARGRDVPPHPR